MLFLFLLLALLQSTAVLAAPCASFAQKCSVEVGKVFGDSANQGAIQLNNGKSFYFTMSVSPSYFPSALLVVLFSPTLFPSLFSSLHSLRRVLSTLT